MILKHCNYLNVYKNKVASFKKTKHFKRLKCEFFLIDYIFGIYLR